MSDVPAPHLDALAKRDLRDDERLKTLHMEAIRRGFWASNTTDALELFCLAERTLHDEAQQTPGRLFRGLIKQMNRKFVTQAVESRTLRRLPSHEHRALLDRAARGNALPVPISCVPGHAEGQPRQWLSSNADRSIPASLLSVALGGARNE